MLRNPSVYSGTFRRPLDSQIRVFTKKSFKSTYYLKYILPLLLLGAIIFVTIFCIYHKYYPVLIVPIYWLIGSIINGKFTYRYNISDVFMDYEHEIFVVSNPKKECSYPFSELVSVKSSFGDYIVKLKFEKNKKVLFASPSDNLFGIGNSTLVAHLKSITKK